MTVMATEFRLGEDLARLEHLDFEFETPCEIPERAAKAGGGTPRCPGRPARWVGWRVNCCPESPNYILLCDECKKVYQAWLAQGAQITCIECLTENAGFIAYTSLNKQS